MESNYNSNVRSVQAFNPSNYVVPGLSEKDIIEIKEVFDQMDLDGNGYLSPVELRAALYKYGNLNAHKNTIYHLLTEYDNEMLGELSFGDFLEIAAGTKKPSLDSKLKRGKRYKESI